MGRRVFWAPSLWAFALVPGTRDERFGKADGLDFETRLKRSQIYGYGSTTPADDRPDGLRSLAHARGVARVVNGFCAKNGLPCLQEPRFRSDAGALPCVRRRRVSGGPQCDFCGSLCEVNLSNLARIIKFS